MRHSTVFKDSQLDSGQVVCYSDPIIKPFDIKIEEYKIKGCQSSVWLNGEERDGKLFFSADSDSTFVKGEIALLMMVLSGQTAEDVLEAKLEFIDALGLRQHIAVTRANGLASMIKQMKTYAFAMSSANK